MSVDVVIRPDETISVVAEARLQAERALAAAIADAEQVEREAAAAAAASVAAEQDAYRVRAAGIMDEAVADAERLLAHARRQAAAIEARADAGSGDRLADLEREIVERQAMVCGRLAAAERSSTASFEQTEAHAASLREAARIEAEAIVVRARLECDALLAEAEQTRVDAEDRLAAALSVAAERGRSMAQSTAGADVADAQREAEKLEAEIVQYRELIEQVEADARTHAHEKAVVVVQQAKSIAATIAQDALHETGLRSETYVHIRAILDAWERTRAELVADGVFPADADDA